MLRSQAVKMRIEISVEKLYAENGPTNQRSNKQTNELLITPLIYVGFVEESTSNFIVKLLVLISFELLEFG